MKILFTFILLLSIIVASGQTTNELKDNSNQDSLKENSYDFPLRLYSRNTNQELIDYGIWNFQREWELEEQIEFLSLAFKIDSLKEGTNYLLGKKHYEAFTKGIEDDKPKQYIISHAKKSIQYLNEFLQYNMKHQERVKYPLIQLSNYLKLLPRKINEYKKINYQSSYFPLVSLMELPDNWETNFQVDVMFQVEMAFFSLDWYSKHLLAMKEPILNKLTGVNIYRFTWLRTFHKPIVIRLEKSDKKVTLIWKVNDGKGGYDPGKIIIEDKKDLRIDIWDEFEITLESANFWNLKPVNDITIDGSHWILEGKIGNDYHLVERFLGGEIKEACLKLLKFTGMQIDEKEIY